MSTDVSEVLAASIMIALMMRTLNFILAAVRT
jgi:hypothetical protein